MNKPKIITIFLILLLCPVIANTRQPLNQDILDNIDQDINEILESPEFSRQEEVWKLKWKEDEKSEKYIKPEQTYPLAEIIAKILPWLLILSLLIFLIVIIVIKRKNLAGFFTSLSFRNKKEKVSYLQGKKVEKPVLPSEIIQKAKQLWRKNRPTQALSLIYRGAISYFADTMHVPVPASATEDECYTRVNRSLSGQGNSKDLLTDFFHLIRAWLYSAYANRHPDNKGFHFLCDRWDPYFKDQE